MKGFVKFLLIFGGILLISALLAPVLFEFLPFKFEKIFNRLVMILTVVASILFVRVRREKIVGYGLGWEGKESLGLFSKGFFAGVFILGAFMALRLGLGFGLLSFRDLSAVAWTIVFVKIFFSAVLIGVIEEFFFRGFIFRKLWDGKPSRFYFSLLLTNFFYAVVHFVNAKKPFIGEDPGLKDSLKLIAAPLVSSLAWQEIWPGVVGLFIFGLILNWLYIRSGSLYASIGLHAGCVFFVKFDGFFVDFLNTRNLIWGGNKVYDGIVGWVFLGLLAVLLLGMVKKRNVRT